MHSKKYKEALKLYDQEKNYSTASAME